MHELICSSLLLSVNRPELRVFGEIGSISELLSLLCTQIITYLCDCVRMHCVWGVCASAHVFAHFHFTFSAPPGVTMCIHGLACECVLFSLSVFHAQHCLLETLSKSPQRDNWLPGVLLLCCSSSSYPAEKNGA